jgi:hypothetical protein
MEANLDLWNLAALNSEMCDVSNYRWGKPACLGVGNRGQLASSSSHLGPHWLRERAISGYGGRFDFGTAFDFAGAGKPICLP